MSVYPVPPQFAPDHWDQVGYYYQPIAFYNNQVLKCGGIATKGNAWVLEEKPGTIILPKYLGDRIKADDHSLFGNPQ